MNGVMDYVTILGLSAAFFTTFAFLPQVLRIWKLKEARDISFWTFLLMTTGVLLWLIYGIYINDFPIIIANAITLLLSSTVLYYKIRYFV